MVCVEAREVDRNSRMPLSRRLPSTLTVGHLRTRYCWGHLSERKLRGTKPLSELMVDVCEPLDLCATIAVAARSGAQARR